MKYICLTTIFFLSFISINAQNTSAGISLSSMKYNGDFGHEYSFNLRSQLAPKWAWQTQVGHGKSDLVRIVEEIEPAKITITEYSEKYTYLNTSAVYKLASINDVYVEMMLGGGLIANRIKVFGLVSGGVFLSTKITPHIVVGIPLSYNFIFWEQDYFYSAGVSLRYHI